MWPYSWVIGCQKWPFCIFYGILLKIAVFGPMLLINKGLFFYQTKWYSTHKKRLFQMASFKFHGKNYWESSKLKNSKITPSRENHAHFISCKPPHKNHPREHFGTTLCFIQIATSVVEKSQFLSIAFHLAATVLVHWLFCNFPYRKYSPYSNLFFKLWLIWYVGIKYHRRFYTITTVFLVNRLKLAFINYIFACNYAIMVLNCSILLYLSSGYKMLTPEVYYPMKLI